MQAVLDKEHKGCVAANTLHSCAMRLLNLEPLEEQEEEGGRVLDYVSFQNWMKEQWGEDLEEYIEQAVHQCGMSLDSIPLCEGLPSMLLGGG